MIVTIDFETTGFEAGKDEVLQVSIIDENYKILINEYCKPTSLISWQEAQEVHGITPHMVKDKLPFQEHVSKIKRILEKAEKIIAYNTKFEKSFLEAYGIYTAPQKWIDPMILFAKIYGEYDSRNDTYKRQSLKTCAKYYNFEFRAHNSLEDVKATLYCYKKMIREDNVNGRSRNHN